MTRRVEALRSAFAAEGQRQHVEAWTRGDLEDLVTALDALAAPFREELERRWEIEAEQD